MNLEELQKRLKNYNLSPNKVRGQNFLISDTILDNIIDTTALLCFSVLKTKFIRFLI